MERKTLKKFHNDLSWSTRIYTLLTVSIIVFAWWTNAWESNWVMTMLLALAVILFVESFAISFHQHPNTWRMIRWIFIFILMALLLIGAMS